MAREIWKKILDIARKKISPAQFDTWLKPLNFIRIENDVVLVSTPNPLAREFVENEFKDLFEDIIKELQMKGLSISLRRRMMEIRRAMMMEKMIISSLRGSILTKKRISITPATGISAMEQGPGMKEVSATVFK